MKEKLSVFAWGLISLVAFAVFVFAYYTAGNLSNQNDEVPNSLANSVSILESLATAAVDTPAPGNKQIDTLKRNADKKPDTSKKPDEKKEVKKPVKEATVLICNSNSSVAYHSSMCRGLQKFKAGTSSVTKSQAQTQGYRACKICY